MSDTIHVSMFGGFSIRLNNHQLTDEMFRTKKVWLLIEYLLCNRAMPTSLDKLMDVLWADESSANPLGALKNLVYRARQELKSLDETIGPDLISFSNNTYEWNSDYPCEIDVEEFVSNCKKADAAENSDEDKMRYCQKAFGLYSGEFLPRSASSDWVMTMSSYYANLFTHCALTLCELLRKKKQYSQIIEIVHHAISYSPYEEKLHRFLLESYLRLGEYRNFKNHYTVASKIFRKEFGADLSPETQALEEEVRNNLNGLQLDLSKIRDSLYTPVRHEHAYYCDDYRVFKEIYQTMARMLARLKTSVHMGLFTMMAKNDMAPQATVMMENMKLLKQCAIYNLRRGDIIASYNARQLIVLLPMTSSENAQKILDRILAIYRKENNQPSVIIHTTVCPVKPFENNE